MKAEYDFMQPFVDIDYYISYRIIMVYIGAL